jgi:prefoldin alpha subunit
MAEVSPLTVSNEREVTAADLNLDQLSGLKQQHEQELGELQGQLEQLHGAKNRYISAKSTLDDMSSSPAGSKMLVPLTSSLYVPGTVHRPEKVTVELGTGYFCEKTVPEAKELIARKVRKTMLYILFNTDVYGRWPWWIVRLRALKRLAPTKRKLWTTLL